MVSLRPDLNGASRYLLLGFFAILSMIAAACGSSDPEIIRETVIVPQTVVVPGAASTVLVPGEIVRETVVVPGAERTVVVVATPTSAPVESAPDPQSSAGTVELVAPNRVGLAMTGVNSADAPDGPWGIAEGFFQPCGPVGADIVCPVLASTWEVASDLSKITFGLKRGVQFHDGWGEMTAEDVVWSFNEIIDPVSIHNQSGDYSANFGKMVLIDSYTVEVPVSNYSVVWNQILFNTFAGTNGTFSKKAFDQMGRDWALENPIATGPFQLELFRPQEIVTLKSFADHHTKPAPVPILNVRDVPEESTRLAMLKTGQADIADISLKRINDLRETGFRTSDSGKASQMAVIFAGNYWEQYDYNCSVGQLSVSCPDITVGVPQLVEPSRDGYTPDEQHPWIGEFGNEASMERARTVRKAMALAIDAPSINEALLNGLGWELFMTSFSTRDPNWDSKWEWQYDPAEAARLLDEANYPVSGGKRFNVNLYITGHAGGPGGTGGEIQSAIGAMWRAIGITTSLDRRDYGTWRPTVVDRSQNQPFLSACGGTDARDSVPWDFPKGVAYTTLSRGGFSCGVEIPFVLEKGLAAGIEPDRVKRVAINTELAEYYAAEWLVPGVVVVPEPLVWNPKKIASWEMRANASGTHIVSLDTIVPVQ